MPDAMDRCQQFNDDATADALARHADRPRTVGRTHCEVADCGEPISSERMLLGARLCLECQKAEEAQGAHFRVWRGGR
jgi:RNA polymerase-binding transcription factor DksA